MRENCNLEMVLEEFLGLKKIEEKFLGLMKILKTGEFWKSLEKALDKFLKVIEKFRTNF